MSDSKLQFSADSLMAEARTRSGGCRIWVRDPSPSLWSCSLLRSRRTRD